jgi:excisionase family DNA binding protein
LKPLKADNISTIRPEALSSRVDNRLLTEQEVADLAQVPLLSVRYWRQTGRLPFVKVGKHARIWQSEFNRVFQKPDKIELLRTLGGSNEQT